MRLTDVQVRASALTASQCATYDEVSAVVHFKVESIA